MMSWNHVGEGFRVKVYKWQYRLFPVRVEIDVYWPKIYGPVEAPITWVLKSAQQAGIIEDTSQVVEVRARKHLNADNPRICIKIALADVDL